MTTTIDIAQLTDDQIKVAAFDTLQQLEEVKATLRLLTDELATRERARAVMQSQQAASKPQKKTAP